MTVSVLAKLLSYGYAPGSYMSTCVTNHRMLHVDKRARRCLLCAQHLVLQDMTMLKADGQKATAAELDAMLLPFKTGLLTAVKGTAVAMTCNGTERVGDSLRVSTLHFEGTELKKGNYNPSELIGAGEELVFCGGIFVRAQSAS